MPFDIKRGVERIWNTRKESLKQLQERFSKTPPRSESVESERTLSSPYGDLRRGNKPPIPPLLRKASKERSRRCRSSDSASISSDEMEYISSSRKSHKKKQDKRKSRRLSFTITPQPPTVLYAPPPMQPMYMPAPMPYAIPYPMMPQQPMPLAANNLNSPLPTKPAKSSLKVQSDDDISDKASSRSKRHRSKRVRILDEKEAVDAGTSTDELSVTVSRLSSAGDLKGGKEVGAYAVENNSEFDWDTYFAPRMAPPLLFGEPNNENPAGVPLESLSMYANTTKSRQQSALSTPQTGHLTIDTSNVPTPLVYQPPAIESPTTVPDPSPTPKYSDDRTMAWLATEQVTANSTVNLDTDQNRSKKLPPIAEEVLKSYDAFKSQHYGPNNTQQTQSLDGELASANRRLTRYFHQLRDIDHFILDQEAKLLDRQHHHVEKKADVKPVKTFVISPRPRHQPVIENFFDPQPPPTITASAPVVTTTQQSAALIEELYSHLDTSKTNMPEKPPTPVDSPKHHKHKHKHKDSKDSIAARFEKSKRFSNWLTDSIIDDLLDEILVFEVGRVMQAVSVEAVSALIERKLAEDLEEKRAMTKKLIERLPSPNEIVETALVKNEATVERIVAETKTTPRINAVEDVDMFFRELTLPKSAESIVKDVLDIDIRALIREVLLEESIESVLDDFIISQVVAGEMLTLASESLVEFERRQKRNRRRQMKDTIDGPVLHAMLLDLFLAELAKQSVILSPYYELDLAVYDLILQTMLSKTLITLSSRNMVAECLPMRRYHEKVVTDVAMDAIVNELIKSLDIDMAEVDDFETGRDLSFPGKTPTMSPIFSAR